MRRESFRVRSIPDDLHSIDDDVVSVASLRWKGRKGKERARKLEGGGASRVPFQFPTLVVPPRSSTLLTDDFRRPDR